MIKKRFRNTVSTGKGKARLFRAGLTVMASLAGITNGYAGQTFQMGGDKSLSLGFGIRTSYTSLQNGAPDGVSRSNKFDVENMRLYISGQLNNMIKATLNTERDATGKIVLMDGFTELAFNDDFNVRLGRLIPPTDRSNLDGPFYLNVWQFPIVSAYPSLAIGRDNGLLAWGKPMGGKVVYSVGAFTGHNIVAGGSNASANLLYAGRLAINLLDPEPDPAYYTSSTYYGSNDIFTVGLVYQTQKDGVGSSPTVKGNYNSWSTDLLFEKKVPGDGVVTFEGAYYKYGLGAVDCGSGEPGSGICPAGGTNVGGLVAGKAYLATLEYMFPQKVGIGNFQPFVRVQNFKRDVSQTTNKQTDVGINYIISGHNARISAVYSRLNDNRLAPALASSNQFIAGIQIQY